MTNQTCELGSPGVRQSAFWAPELGGCWELGSRGVRQSALWAPEFGKCWGWAVLRTRESGGTPERALGSRGGWVRLGKCWELGSGGVRQSALWAPEFGGVGVVGLLGWVVGVGPEMGLQGAWEFGQLEHLPWFDDVRFVRIGEAAGVVGHAPVPVRLRLPFR